MATQDRMAPHRIARFLRKLGWILIAVNFLLVAYSMLVLRNSTISGPAAGAAILIPIVGPSLGLYGLSLFFPTVRIDHCPKCAFHEETSLWKEPKTY